MAILNFNTQAPSDNSNRGNTPFGGHATDKPKSKIWANIGYPVGEGADAAFINLPLGLPIDTMKPVEAKGQNPDWIAKQNASNQLLNDLINEGADMEPGEERIINLQVRLRRVNEEMVVAAADNSYSRPASMSLTSKPVEQPELEPAE